MDMLLFQWEFRGSFKSRLFNLFIVYFKLFHIYFEVSYFIYLFTPTFLQRLLVSAGAPTHGHSQKARPMGSAHVPSA